jgi:hypothetical protein
MEQKSLTTANYKAIEVAFPNSNYCYIADNLKKDFTKKL